MSTRSFPQAEFEAMYRLKREAAQDKKWLSHFTADAAVVAE